jgi:hypothetical protein
MDFDSRTAHVAVLFSLTVLINLPFGYFRRKTRHYSFKWFLYIHIPIPFIFIARVLSHLDFRYIPLFILAAFIGQLVGGRMEI